MKKLALLVPILLVAGCSTAASRMAECEAQGISRDTCYMAEQNRQATSRAAYISASEAQAYKNQDRALHKHHHKGY